MKAKPIITEGEERSIFPVTVNDAEKNQLKRLLTEAKIRYKIRTVRIIIRALEQLLKGDGK